MGLLRRQKRSIGSPRNDGKGVGLLRRAFGPSRNDGKSYIAVVVLLSLTSLVSLNLFFRQRAEHDLLDIRTFPHTVGEWKGQDLEITEREYEILETRNLISREYVNPSGGKLFLFVIYSETNRAVFHPPEVCLIGSGINITDKRSERIDSDKSSFFVNKLYTEKGDYRGIALYCYRAGKLYTDNFYLQQIHFAFNQLLGKHRGGATIRVTMSIGKDEEATLAMLKSFMKETIKIMEGLS